MHAMLQARGIDGGIPRRPLLPAPDDLVAEIKERLKELQLI
jgi:dihydrodipicolinate synthase/N-acetylneuraminate lyase